MAGDRRHGLSKGGMKTKIIAARTATAGGCAMVIAGPVRPISAHGKLGHAPRGSRPQGDPRARANAGSRDETARLCGRSGRDGALGAGSPCCPPVCHPSASSGAASRRVSGPEGRGAGQGLVRYTSRRGRQIRAAPRRDRRDAGLPGRAALIHRDDMGYCAPTRVRYSREKAEMKDADMPLMADDRCTRHAAAAELAFASARSKHPP